MPLARAASGSNPVTGAVLASKREPLPMLLTRETVVLQLCLPFQFRAGHASARAPTIGPRSAIAPTRLLLPSRFQQLRSASRLAGPPTEPAQRQRSRPRLSPSPRPLAPWSTRAGRQESPATSPGATSHPFDDSASASRDRPCSRPPARVDGTGGRSFSPLRRAPTPTASELPLPAGPRLCHPRCRPLARNLYASGQKSCAEGQTARCDIAAAGDHASAGGDQDACSITVIALQPDS